MTFLIQRLEWDSEFFGVPVAKVVPDCLSDEQMQEVLAWCDDEQIKCAYFLVASDNPTSIRLAEQAGFSLIDLRITLECALPGPFLSKLSPAIRPVLPKDLPELRKIAEGSHRDSRFYQDPHFIPDKVDELYRIWIEKSCNGDADAVLVAEVEGQVAGYITCHLDDEETGRIGLMAVGPQARGRGFGTLLVRHALSWFLEQSRRRATVVTQGRNIPAQRLYQHSEFITYDIDLWYHRWFGDHRTMSR